MSDKNSEYHTDHTHLSEEDTKEFSSHLLNHLMQDEDVMREDFERILCATYPGYKYDRNDLGLYCDPYLSAVWRGWKACHAQSQQEATRLRREVAMLFSILKRTWERCSKEEYQRLEDDAKEAINNTQATAQAYEAEVKAAALEEAAVRFEKYGSGYEMFMPAVADELRCIVESLRATSKKG